MCVYVCMYRVVYVCVACVGCVCVGYEFGYVNIGYVYICMCMYVCSLSRDGVLHPEIQWLGLWHSEKVEYHTLCLLGA